MIQTTIGLHRVFTCFYKVFTHTAALCMFFSCRKKKWREIYFLAQDDLLGLPSISTYVGYPRDNQVPDFLEVSWLSRCQSLCSFGNNNLCTPAWSACNGAVSNPRSTLLLCITLLLGGWRVPSVLLAHQRSGNQTAVKPDKSHIIEMLGHTRLH